MGFYRPLQGRVLDGYVAASGPAGTGPRATVPDESRNRSIYRQPRPPRPCLDWPAFSGGPDRGNRGTILTLLFVDARRPTLSRRSSRRDFFPRPEASDELLRSQSRGPAGDTHDDGRRCAPGDVFLGRDDPDLRFRDGLLDRRNHVLSRRAADA